MDIELIEVPATNSAEVKSATSVLINREVDVILISPSNIVFSALDVVINTGTNAGIPVIGGDETAVSRGSIATYGFSNRDVGIATAEIVLQAKELDNKSLVGSIPVAQPKKNKLYININQLEKLLIKLPEKPLTEANKE